MEITDVSLTKLEVETAEPRGLSRGRELDARVASLVVMETDTGLRGIREGVGPELHAVEAFVEESYRPKLVGGDPLDCDRLWREIVVDDVYWDRKGQGVAATSGVDIALWDLTGKYYDTPVHRLLGGPPLIQTQ